MTDSIPPEVRCPHCEGVIPPEWVLNVCPQCGRRVSLEALRRAAVAVAEAPTEESPSMPEASPEGGTPNVTEPPEGGTTNVAALPTRPCVHHPNVESAQFCPMCGKSYCDDCLVEFFGRKICGECKDAEVAALQRQGSAQTPMTGLILGIIGAAGGAMCCLLGVCSIIGLVMGYQSLGEINENKLPRSSRPTALAAVIVGWVGVAVLVLHVVYFLFVWGFSVWTAR